MKIESAMQICGSLSRDQIQKILAKYDNSIDKAIKELIETNNREDEKQQKFIQEMYDTYNELNEEEIKKTLEENDFDIEKSKKLIEEEQLKNQMMILRSKYAMQYSGLIKNEELRQIMEENQMDEEKISVHLDKIYRERLLKELVEKFEGKLSLQEIQDCCEKSNWNRSDARIACVLLEQKKSGDKEKNIDEYNINNEAKLIKSLISITGCKRVAAYRLLANTEWNLDEAVNNYFETASDKLEKVKNRDDDEEDEDGDDNETEETENAETEEKDDEDDEDDHEKLAEMYKHEIKMMRGMFPEEDIDNIMEALMSNEFKTDLAIIQLIDMQESNNKKATETNIQLIQYTSSPAITKPSDLPGSSEIQSNYTKETKNLIKTIEHNNNQLESRNNKSNDPYELIERLQQIIALERKSIKRMTEKYLLAQKRNHDNNKFEEYVPETKNDSVSNTPNSPNTSNIDNSNDNQEYERILEQRESDIERREQKLERKMIKYEKRKQKLVKQEMEMKKKMRMLRMNEKNISFELRDLQEKMQNKEPFNQEFNQENNSDQKIEEKVEDKEFQPSQDLVRRLERIKQSLQRPSSRPKPQNNEVLLNSKNIPAMFEAFMKTNDLISIVDTFEAIKKVSGIQSRDGRQFYKEISSFLSKSVMYSRRRLFEILNIKFEHTDYNEQVKRKVMIIGAGPAGLRSAIEASLLGCEVVILEGRDSFSRNNVLHLWKQTTIDLKTFGANIFIPQFCIGGIDHCSILNMQCFLLKVSLLFGVKFFHSTKFTGVSPPSKNKGWSVLTQVPNNFISSFRFDVLVGADGENIVTPENSQYTSFSNALDWKKSVTKTRLSIGITFNILKKFKPQEVKEINLSYQYRPGQVYFDNLHKKTGIKLENLVYYSDSTNYFVCTANKESLLEKGVFKQDFQDTMDLFHKDNIDSAKLKECCLGIAFNCGIPKNCEFATIQTSFGAKDDLAIFDFSSSRSAATPIRVMENKLYQETVSLTHFVVVGDAAKSPFWPLGTGANCAMLSALDFAFMLKMMEEKGLFTSAPKSTLKPEANSMISIYNSLFSKLKATTRGEDLKQVVPQKENPKYNSFTLNPETRYSDFFINKDLYVINTNEKSEDYVDSQI